MQPWIQSKIKDSIFILSPPFLVLVLVVLFGNKLTEVNDFIFWFAIVVLIDVAHVYSTLFKTYFDSAERRYFRRVFYIVPVVCFSLALFLYQLGDFLFWRCMAYIALYHFVRQQYGFYKIYVRFEDNTSISYRIGIVAIYAATLHPMMIWFFGPKRNFNWFMDNDFLHYSCPWLVQTSWIFFIGIQLSYIISEICIKIKSGRFNIPKNLLWLGTLLSWNLGIIYYNNDIIFSLFNIVAHGVPYMALIFFRTLSAQDIPPSDLRTWIAKRQGKLVLFLFIIFVLAIIEEYIWDFAVWREHFFDYGEKTKDYLWIVVPLLSLPQLTHYVLDGFIWKRKAE